MQPLIGKSAGHGCLTEREVIEVCAEATAALQVSGKKILILIPDQTQGTMIGLFFRIIYDLVGERATTLDCLVASGAQQVVELKRMYQLVGITPREHRERFPRVFFYDHEHDNPEALRRVGTISAEAAYRLTDGLLREELPVCINRRVMEYDHVFILSPVVLREHLGYSGGNEIFFPGASDLDVSEAFRRIEAGSSSIARSGEKDSCSRKVADEAATFLDVSLLCFAFVPGDHDQCSCVFAGDTKEAWSHAVEYAANVQSTRASLV